MCVRVCFISFFYSKGEIWKDVWLNISINKRHGKISTQDNFYNALIECHQGKGLRKKTSMQIGNNEKLHLSFYIHKLSLGSKADEEVSGPWFSNCLYLCSCEQVSQKFTFFKCYKNWIAKPSSLCPRRCILLH